MSQTVPVDGLLISSRMDYVYNMGNKTTVDGLSRSGRPGHKHGIPSKKLLIKSCKYIVCDLYSAVHEPKFFYRGPL